MSILPGCGSSVHTARDGASSGGLWRPGLWLPGLCLGLPSSFRPSDLKFANHVFK